jgi:hypothetical protein
MTQADPRFSLLAHTVDAVFLAAAGLLYLSTLYPYLWWGDGPELVTAAWTDGVAHPTGYPVYLVLLKTFLWIPLGSIAWRAHLFSAVATLVGFTYLLRLFPFDRERIAYFIGWRIGLSFLALSPLLWEVSILTEVYSLSFVFFGAILLVAKRWMSNPTRNGLLFLALLVGLAVGHHRLLGLMLPGLALGLAPAVSSGRTKWIWRTLAIPVLLVALAGPYFLTYLRAQGFPPLNWEDASTLGGLWNLFSGAQFRTDQKIVRLQEWALYSRNAGPNPWSISSAILSALPLLGWENLRLGLLAALAGAVFLFRETPRIFWSGLVAWLIPTVFLAQYHVADLEQFHSIPFFLLGLGCAAGCGRLLEWTAAKNRFAGVALAVLLVGSIAFSVTGFTRPAETIAEVPERYARRTLDALPQSSILLAQPALEGQAGDYVYYPLLYMKEVARRGTGAALISTSFMTSPWYRSTVGREGIETGYFDDLEGGTAKIPVVDFDHETFLQGDRALRFYRFGDRLIGNGYRSFVARLGESFFPQIEDRPLYATSDWKELEPFLEREVKWTEVLRVPILTRGVSSLDGKPLPTGKLYRAEFADR